MTRPADTCPECGAPPVRVWLDAPYERRRCHAGHTWSGDALPREPSTDERIANLERAASAMLAWMQAHCTDPGAAVVLRDAIAGFEMQRPT